MTSILLKGRFAPARRIATDVPRSAKDFANDFWWGRNTRGEAREKELLTLQHRHLLPSSLQNLPA
jgi:hypothetical protein